MVIRKYPKGFSAIEGVLILLFLVLLLGAGWYVYTKRHTNKTKVTAVSQQKNTSPTKAPPVDPTADWSTYSNAMGKYLIKYPNNLVYVYCETTVLLEPPGGVYTNGAQFCGDGPAASIRVTEAEGDQRGKENDNGVGYEVTNNTTGTVMLDSGVTGESKSGIVTEDEPAGPSMTGYTQILYTFYTNGRTYFCLYSQPSNSPVSSATFDLIIKKTLKFTN